ncbi:MAG: hypothetical protein LBQ05_03015 [Christensenellaceae bacterium]|nr:hypothetical protein [Christensenellaceae bacterium]
MENKQNEIGQTDSDLTLSGRIKLTVTGVKKIKSSEPTQIILILSNCAMVIGGTNLYIVTASISTGEIEILGLVDNIKYTGTQQKQKFSLRNMFK